jgi:hypothetical protein
MLVIHCCLVRSVAHLRPADQALLCDPEMSRLLAHAMAVSLSQSGTANADAALVGVRPWDLDVDEVRSRGYSFGAASSGMPNTRSAA